MSTTDHQPPWPAPIRVDKLAATLNAYAVLAPAQYRAVLSEAASLVLFVGGLAARVDQLERDMDRRA